MFICLYAFYLLTLENKLVQLVSIHIKPYPSNYDTLMLPVSSVNI